MVMAMSRKKFKCLECSHLITKEDRTICFMNSETGKCEPFIQYRLECEIFKKGIKELKQEKIGYDCVHFEPKSKVVWREDLGSWVLKIPAPKTWDKINELLKITVPVLGRVTDKTIYDSLYHGLVEGTEVCPTWIFECYFKRISKNLFFNLAYDFRMKLYKKDEAFPYVAVAQYKEDVAYEGDDEWTAFWCVRKLREKGVKLKNIYCIFVGKDIEEISASPFLYMQIILEDGEVVFQSNKKPLLEILENKLQEEGVIYG